MGKGGVGKSTLSSIVSVYLSSIGKKVILSSLDPAHNLSDIFETKFSDKLSQVSPNLFISEVDQEKWIKQYLKRNEQIISKSYNYLTSFSLEKHFSVMRYAPGIEEYALLMPFYNVIKNNKSDYFIFDMPPTALSLKFFAMPKLTLIWLEKLITLRDEIIKKEKIINTLRLGKKEFERDRVKQNLNEQSEFFNIANEHISNSAQTSLILVQNPDELSQKESARIKKKLKELKLPNPLVFLNKAKLKPDGKFDFEIPQTNYPLQKMGSLMKVLSEIDGDKLAKLF